ncbi:MAG: NAD(P)/FAD-dependent oxidoreductase [Streptosporangiaceae bacterium]
MDVLIVGGGPAGLGTAIQCALAGLEVTVAEPRPGPIDKACGEGLMPAAVTSLAALGVAPGGHPFRGIRYLDEKHRADGFFRGGPGLGVRRTELHAALSSRARALGVRVLPVRVTGFSQDGDCVTAAGLAARYLVAADGLHSVIRRACALDPLPAARPRYGLRRHYRVTPWSDMVEVHWSPMAEAYVTPVADDLVGVAILGPRTGGSAGFGKAGSGGVGPGGEGAGEGDAGEGGFGEGGFDCRLAAFPGLRERLAGALPVGRVRGAGPLRQDVARRTSGRVLLVGDAAGYLDALTGEGISVALTQAAVLARCLRADRPGDYEDAWRRASRKSRLLTSGLLWSRHSPVLARRIVPAAERLPRLFTAIVNQVAGA